MSEPPAVRAPGPPKEEPSSRFRKLVGKVLEGTIIKVLTAGVVAVLTGVVGYLLGVNNERTKYEQRLHAAPEEYVALIKAQIEATDRGEALDARFQTRSILRVRDDLRGSLLNLSKHLNSEIDRLAELLQRYEQSPTEDLDREIRLSFRVLRQTWPAKEKLIAYELRKVLAELGLDRISR